MHVASLSGATAFGVTRQSHRVAGSRSGTGAVHTSFQARRCIGSISYCLRLPWKLGLGGVVAPVPCGSPYADISVEAADLDEAMCDWSDNHIHKGHVTAKQGTPDLGISLARPISRQCSSISRNGRYVTLQPYVNHESSTTVLAVC